jgi:polygalacturonase
MFAAGASPMERNVRDFGAVPDDGKDDTQAIRKAAAGLKDGDRLVFGRGQFDVTNWIVRITGKIKNLARVS